MWVKKVVACDRVEVKLDVYSIFNGKLLFKKGEIGTLENNHELTKLILRGYTVRGFVGGIHVDYTSALRKLPKVETNNEIQVGDYVEVTHKVYCVTDGNLLFNKGFRDKVEFSDTLCNTLCLGGCNLKFTSVLGYKVDYTSFLKKVEPTKEVKELTMKEVCELLGEEVKIKKEDC